MRKRVPDQGIYLLDPLSQGLRLTLGSLLAEDSSEPWRQPYGLALARWVPETYPHTEPLTFCLRSLSFGFGVQT